MLLSRLENKMYFILKEKQKLISEFNILGMKEYQKRLGFCVKQKSANKTKTKEGFLRKWWAENMCQASIFKNILRCFLFLLRIWF